MRGKITASAIHAAHAVRVTVRHKADVVRIFFKKRLALRVIFLDRFGIDAAEQHIMRAVERRDLAGRAGEQLFKAARAHAEQRIVRETQFRFRDELEVRQFFQRGVMRRAHIGDLDLAGLAGLGDRSGLDWVTVEKTFDRLARRRIAGAAVMRLELETVEDGRIVAGREHHAADGAQMLDGKGNRRRGRGCGREHDLKIISGKNLRCRFREAV